MHTCVYCGHENDDSSTACAGCGTSLAYEPLVAPMSPAIRRTLIAAAAGASCFASYMWWAGGQYRHNHWAEGILWGFGGAVGVTSAFMGWRLAKDGKERLLAAGLLCFHCLSLLLLLLMISFIGARP
jgi:uncharacterized membrane protein YfcA